MSLKELEQNSINLLRETKHQFKKTCLLWSIGKDSTVLLHLCKKAFFGKIPFPIVYLNTGYHFKETLSFKVKLTKKWNLNLIEVKGNQKTNPDRDGRIECCNKLKTNALKKVLKENKFNGVIVGIRRDEHGIRGKERKFSPRNKDFKWNYWNQPIEIGNLLETKTENHIRVHPLLDWTELNVWEYIKLEGIPVNELYFSINGFRYRSLGCMPCTKPVKSNAKNIDEIIEELKTTSEKERSGRSQDKEDDMQKLRALGYM